MLSPEISPFLRKRAAEGTLGPDVWEDDADGRCFADIVDFHVASAEFQDKGDQVGVSKRPIGSSGPGRDDSVI